MKMIVLLVTLSIFLANTFAEPININAEKQVDQVCGELGDCISNSTCANKCGCHSSAAVLFYNETLDECVVDVKRLLMALTEKYNTHENIRQEVDKVFKGIIFASILFITCAGLCMITACLYCCRINYMDTRLKNDVEALAHKLKRDLRLRKTIKKTPTQPGAETCNIVVADAGVFVV